VLQALYTLRSMLYVGLTANTFSTKWPAQRTSLNHRKVMKEEPGRLIPRKLASNSELLLSLRFEDEVHILQRFKTSQWINLYPGSNNHSAGRIADVKSVPVQFLLRLWIESHFHYIWN